MAVRPTRGSATHPATIGYGFDVEAELARVFGDGVRPLRFEQALFEAMLAGWASQQQSRMLCAETIVNRRRLVCRLQGHAAAWPWEWRAEHLEEWIEDLALAPRACHVSTLRNYQIAIRLFCDFLVDRRYPWTAICAERLGRCPQQIVDERNLIVHTNEFEADPSRRPLSRAELEAFFDHCDAQVSGRRALRRKGSLAALSSRRSTRGGCAARRPPASTFSTSPATRTSPASARSARSAYATARRWLADRRGGERADRLRLALEQYLEQIRPLYGRDEHPALWLTERGGRVSSPYISERFAHYRDELGLPSELTPHGLRHSYVTHLIEDGFDPLFVQLQVGHRHASSTDRLSARAARRPRCSRATQRAPGAVRAVGRRHARGRRRAPRPRPPGRLRPLEAPT